MTDLRAHSLKRRLLVSMAAGFGALLLIISILLWNYARDASNRTFDLLLAGAALSVLERVSYNTDGPTVDLPQSAMDILALAADDRIVYRVFSPKYGELTGMADLPLPDTSGPSAEPVFYNADLDEGFRFVLQGRQITSSAGREWVFVQMGQTLNARKDQQLSLFLNGMGGLAVVSLIGLGFVWLAIRASLAPLHQIADTLLARSPRDLSPIEGDPPQEISGLFQAINGFIAQLGRNRALTERFIADVAHQTRTSLSALQGQLALASDAETPEALRERLGRTSAQAERTVRLTNQLLSNAMVSHRSEEAQLEPLDLRPLVRNTLAELLRERRLRKATLSFDDAGLPDGRGRIRGDAISIREALRNLIDNAIRHGGEDNTIVIRLDGDETTITLTVSDAGPGIAPADRLRATERFTSINRATAGSGLGLAIVRSVAEGHDARLTLGTSRLGGLRASILFRRLAVMLLAGLLALIAAPRAEADELLVHAATDPAAMRPLIEAFEARNPAVDVVYHDYQTVDLYQELLDPSPETVPDLVISSAMDLQVDLVNRGLAHRLRVPQAWQPPEWASWRSELFGFTFEPAAILYDRRVLPESNLPTSHRDLSSFIRDHEDELRGKIGGYDLRRSGIGYLFATQDTIQSVQAQRLMEVLGRANIRTFNTTASMVQATREGRICMALNIISSYAMALVADDPNIGVHFLDDYNLVMTRSAFVPRGARNPVRAEAFIGFLLSPEGQAILDAETPLFSLMPPAGGLTPPALPMPRSSTNFLPIRLGPSLLTFLDRIKREDFLRNWDSTLMGDPGP
ncbi:two-component system, OmpR family, sensor histidine kinase TctE (plasmid) [Salipiger profundus]|jgi:two-component system sensor histidine kinase TctE|uniref:histidine kinase n=1 Tax=Salipiger profundus TaxID=1229727 RepID=A0A1U7DCQ4_9RHOB|nr:MULTISPECIES: extracellular solute-binding protein [Salipiger]APX25856.1 two-component system, OmpR family, sensor histidine kinase TctE [Salipiger profundus]SFC80662.1 two-component system, OmpR family, sensor histidine kinase TctE [Salipiger profundus]